MPIDIQNMLNEIKSGILSLAESQFKDLTKNAKSDADEILNLMKTDLIDWANQLANGEISVSEFESLVLSQKGSLTMKALMEAGVAAIQLDKFKQDVLNLTVKTVTKNL